MAQGCSTCLRRLIWEGLSVCRWRHPEVSPHNILAVDAANNILSGVPLARSPCVGLCSDCAMVSLLRLLWASSGEGAGFQAWVHKGESGGGYAAFLS